PSLGVTYLAQPISSTVFVLSSKDSALLGVLKVPPNPAGLAVDSRLHLLYVSSDPAGVITVFDEKTRHIARTMSIGGHPSGLSLMNKGRALLVTDSISGTIQELPLGPHGGPPIELLDVGPGADATAMLSPVSAPDAARILVWGRGFAPGEAVEVYWGLKPLVRAHADGAGMVMTHFIVPRRGHLGQQLIVLIGRHTTHSESTLLTVIKTPPPPKRVPVKPIAPKPLLQRLLGPKLMLVVPTAVALGPLKKLAGPKSSLGISAFELEAAVAMVCLVLIMRMRRRRRKKAATVDGSPRGRGKSGPPRALKGAA
ncbi:MAG: YncE family protein, partial [Chloroflexota bacterium]